LHFNEDFVAVQLSDTTGPEPSRRMVVTDLYRTTQPIIRYELNDLIELDPEPCPCGSAFRVVRRIHGRADDLVWARRAARRLRPSFLDYFRRFIVRATEVIEEYQITQTDEGPLRIRLQLRTGAVPEDAAAAVRRSLASMYADHACPAPQMEFEFGPPE